MEFQRYFNADSPLFSLLFCLEGARQHDEACLATAPLHVKAAWGFACDSCCEPFPSYGAASQHEARCVMRGASAAEKVLIGHLVTSSFCSHSHSPVRVHAQNSISAGEAMSSATSSTRPPGVPKLFDEELYEQSNYICTYMVITHVSIYGKHASTYGN